jgi:hypothetical protein
MLGVATISLTIILPRKFGYPVGLYSALRSAVLARRTGWHGKRNVGTGALVEMVVAPNEAGALVISGTTCVRS